MDSNTYTSIRLSTWVDYKVFVDNLSENWAFRGQINSRWRLRTAIERTDFIKNKKGIEAEFVSEFQRGARNYLNNDELPEHLIEWLALMQHHGAPTRLLDFSRSPFIAAFFSFEQCFIRDDIDVAIWAINYNFLKNKALAELAKQFPDDNWENKKLINDQLFEKIFYQNECNLVFPVEPFRMNRRYSLQQSIFLSTGNSSKSFIEQLEFLGDDMAKAVIRIEMPSGLHKEVLRDLQRMNLNRASLFPDLDGYAASLRLRYNTMKTPEEAVEQHISKLEDDGFAFIP